MDQDRRQRLQAAKAEIRELERPEREARKIAAAKARKGREQGLSRSAGQRAPRLREPLYLAWIRRQPCVACAALGVIENRNIEAAHIRAGYAEDGWAPTGMMQKPDDARVAPLCAPHHRTGPNAQHRANERAWWAALGIHPPTMVAELRAAFLAGGNR